jgi:arylsulfatase A
MQLNLRFIAFFISIITAFTSWCSASETTPPNIIIFLADDLGYGDLACYGHPVIKTPHLDRFAQQGMKLTQCYSASAVCSPSRSAILTGRTPYRNGVFTWIPENQLPFLRTSEITSAKLLKSKGYDTAHVGKWHLNGFFNNPNHPQPSDHGFNHWYSTQNNAAPSHKNPNNFVSDGKPVGELQGYSAELVADEAIRWLKSGRDKTKPFFLCVWTHEPHLPIETDPKFQSPYQNIENPDIRQHHGNVSQMDDAFGRLMKSLDELQLTDSTFVAFTADNGPEGNGDNGRTRGSTGGLRGRKRDVYEGGIRVPGIVRWPGKIKPGTVNDTPVIGSDWFPTVCEITNTKMPSDRVIDGGSLLPLLTKSEPVVRSKPLYWRCNIARTPIKTAMRIGDWKIVATEDLSRMELYNLKTDMAETTDLSKTNPAKFAEMKSALISLNTEIEAEGPQWWIGYQESGSNAAKKKAAAKKKSATKSKSSE